VATPTMKRLLSSRTRDMRRRSQPRPLYDELEARDCRPIIPPKLTPDVKREPDTAPGCEHRSRTLAGPDFKRHAAKWRCPTGECGPASSRSARRSRYGAAAPR
jgi:hypothetical protein